MTLYGWYKSGKPICFIFLLSFVDNFYLYQLFRIAVFKVIHEFSGTCRRFNEFILEFKAVILTNLLESRKVTVKKRLN